MAPTKACTFSQIRVAITKYHLLVKDDLINNHLLSQDFVEYWFSIFTTK